MKFSTILTSTFFALFIFASTTTFASLSTPTAEKTTIDAKKELIGDYIVTVSGRSANVENRNGRLPGNATITVKVTKGIQTVFEQSGSAAGMDIDLNELSAGTYLLQIITSEGIERHIIALE